MTHKGQVASASAYGMWLSIISLLTYSAKLPNRSSYLAFA